MADGAPPGVDPSSSCQLDDRGGAASSSAAGTGGGKAATDEHEEQGAGLQIGNGRRGVEKPRDAISRSSGEFREEPIATEKGGVQRGPQRDPSPRRSPSRRSGGRPEDNRGGPAEQGSRKKRRLAKSMGSTTKPEGAGEERRNEPYPSAESYEQESLETVGVADDGETLLDAMKSWSRQEECGGLTVSQSGALMALATFRSGTPLGRYLERLVKPGSDVGAEGSRQRSLLPLPLLPDSITEMSKLFETGEFKRLAGSWGSKKTNKEKAAKEMRRVGLLVWHGMVVCLVNFLWCGGGAKGPVHRGAVSKAQKLANDRLWNLVRDFVDDHSETKEKLPRSPDMGEWRKRLGDVRISYHGEVVEKAQRLTLDQVMPGLPPQGYGASVPLIELCEGELRTRLEDPMSNLLPEEELPDDIPAPKVHASEEQWEMIVKELHTRGLVRPVEDPVEVKGKPLLNGSFGVIKPGKYLDDERPIGFQSHKLCDSYPGWGRPDPEWFTGPATCRPSPGPGFAFVCWWFGVGILPVCLADWVVEADVLLWQGELEVAGVWKRRSGPCGGNCTPHGLGLRCGGPSTCPQEAGIEESPGWRSRTVGVMWDQARQPFPWPRSRRTTLEPLPGWHKSVGDPGEEGGCRIWRQSARRTRAATQGLPPLGHPGVPEQVPAASLERWKAWGCPWWGQGFAEGGNPTSPREHIIGAVDLAAGVCTEEGFASAAGAWSPHDAIQKTDFRCFRLPLEGDQWWCGDVGLGIKILWGDLSCSHESAPACHWPAVKDSRCGHSLGCQWDRWWSGVWWKADQPGDSGGLHGWGGSGWASDRGPLSGHTTSDPGIRFLCRHRWFVSGAATGKGQGWPIGGRGKGPRLQALECCEVAGLWCVEWYRKAGQEGHREDDAKRAGDHWCGCGRRKPVPGLVQTLVWQKAPWGSQVQALLLLQCGPGLDRGGSWRNADLVAAGFGKCSGRWWGCGRDDRSTRVEAGVGLRQWVVQGAAPPALLVKHQDRGSRQLHPGALRALWWTDLWRDSRAHGADPWRRMALARGSGWRGA